MNADNKEEKGIKNHSLRIKFLVEIVGTFILVYAICSAATVYAVTSHIGTQFGVVGLGQLGVIGIGLVHALVLTAIVYAIAYRYWCSS